MHRTKRLLISILTLLCCCTGAWATGELNGLFTINASGDKVQFSQGNLQYFCSTSAPEWRFAEHQYDYVAFDGSAYAENSEKWIDLFGYGTSGYNNGQTSYQPYSTSVSYGDYYTNNLTGNADWGYNAISNGGNTENSGWRTLTSAEWGYLFNTRASGSTVNGTSNARYTHATIRTDVSGGVNGMILFPDGVTIANSEATSWGTVNGNSAYATKCTSAQWSALEGKGCVFLPAACDRYGSTVRFVGEGYYWSSSPYDKDRAWRVYFYSGFLFPQSYYYRNDGHSVRLVMDYQLEQDASGNYLLGSAVDWKEFAAIVNNGTNPAANAKLTADIDLGDEQTIIGSSAHPYAGVFDGQGYTLTVHLNSASDGVAPFRSIDGATIKNLAVAGSVTGAIHCAGLVGGMPEHSAFNLISNVMVSATITTTGTHCGGILGHGGSTTNTTIQDCLFNGTINGKDGGSTVGVIWGWQTYGSVNIIRCLENGTYTNCSTFDPLFKGWGPSVGSCSNNYYVNGSSEYGTQANATTLSDGTVTEGLNAGRTGDEAAWVQNPVTNQPMLKPFALNTDASGNYLIGSVRDWKDFAAIVNNGTNPAANAKMTADIDLGDDQTRIGSTSDSNTALHYKGIFDGQGHTLKIAFVETGGSNLCAPFNKLDGATIKNLHIKGTITTAGIHGAGVASDARGTTTIMNVWSEVDVTSTHSGWDECSGIVGCMKANSLTISDCLFSGSVTASSSYNGGFIGYKDSGSASIVNSLSTGTFNYTNNQNFARGASVSNSYYTQFVGSTTGMTLATSEQLSNGTTTTALNNGRTGDEAVWVQDIVANQPMLKIFYQHSFIPGDANGDGLVNVTDIVATVNYIMEKPSEGFNKAAADLTGDGEINVTDIVKMVSIIMASGARIME